MYLEVCCFSVLLVFFKVLGRTLKKDLCLL